MSEIRFGPKMSDLACQFRIPQINSIRDQRTGTQHFLSLYNFSNLLLEILGTPR